MSRRAWRQPPCGSVGPSPGRSTPTCDPKARTARWCAPWPAMPPTTNGGRAPGSSRRCSRCVRSRATRNSGSATSGPLAPMVWSAAERKNFVADVRAMRRRVLANCPAVHRRPRELKLGPGGLRDVEFAVQLLQLVHGRGDETLRDGGDACRAGPAARRRLRRPGRRGEPGRRVLASCAAVEHRLQLRRLRRTHLVPEQPAELQRLARAMGYRPDGRGDAREVFEAEWALHGREVRRLHEKLFYRPLLEAVARVPSEELRLTPVEARAPAGGARIRRSRPRRFGTSRR